MAKKKEVPISAEPESIDLEKAFKLATTAVDKKFENVFHAFLYEEEKLEQKRFSSGSISVDMALGGGGLPYGRILEIWGPEGGGKTSLALEVAWHLQRATGKAVVFIDVEHKFDKMLLKQWKGVGFLPNMTRYEEPFTGEDVFGLLEFYVQNPATGIVIVDSISGIRSTATLDADDQQTHFGKQAKLISDYLPKISGLSSRTGVPMIFINQVRANLDAGIYAKGMNKLNKSGGKAYGHYVCISLYLDKIRGKGILSDGVKDIGHWCAVEVAKNHAGPTPIKKFNICLHYGYGFDTVAELIDVCIKLGIVTSSGSWYFYKEYKEQGRDSFIALTREHPDLEKTLWDEVKKTQVQNVSTTTTDVDQTTLLENYDGVEAEIPVT